MDLVSFSSLQEEVLGAVHILRQPISVVFRPPLPPLTSNRQQLPYAPSPPRQPSSAFG